jgi:hypothetical protein
MVVIAPGIAREAGWGPRIGVAIVVVVQYYYYRLGLRDDEPRILPLAGLAVEVAHDAGIPAREPLVESLAVGDRARVGDAAREKAELGGPPLHCSREGHRAAAGTSSGGQSAVGGTGGDRISSVMMRAPRPYVAYDQAH